MKSWITRMLVLALLGGSVAWFHRARQTRETRVAAATRNKTLLIGNSTEIETLDCHLATGVPEHHVISALFEGLVAPAVDNPDADAPGAALSWTHEAFTRWIFKLRPNGKWSDGTPVTAGDFAFAYQRMLTPETGSDYAPMLYPLKNGEAYNKGEVKDFTQVGVKAVDDLTLELNLKSPTPYLPGLLKHYSWFGVPKHVVLKHGSISDRQNRWTKPQNIVSNGPFKLKEWRFTHYLAVDRNPHYWDAKAVKLNEVHFFPISADTAEERAFRDGQLHATYRVPLSRVPYYASQKDGFYRSHRALGVWFLRINTTMKPLDDIRVRQALSLALDRQSIVQNVMRAGQEAAFGITPPGCAEGYKTPNLMRYDVARARQLLAEAGYPNGKGFPRVELLITQSGAARALSETLQEMWKKELGISVGVLSQDWQVYLDAMRKLTYGVAFAGWVGDYPDPTTFLGLWRTGDGNNNTGWGNPDYDRLYAEAEKTADYAERMNLLQKAESLMLEQGAVAPIYWHVNYYLQQRGVLHFHSSLLEHRAYKAIDLE
ncbi:MAG: peptide ABC transporter substrate-binding protein [Verrucomicrobiaceae bacterium]|nr:peptide ABC transporter substrate-binding protein [Verrucomicrobiaceae bacterium]